MAKEITQFTGEWRFLSNFGPGRVIVSSTEYPTREHAYQAHKSLDRAVRLEVASLATPGEAKRFGRRIALRPNWDRDRKRIMLAVVMAAFTQNQDLAGQLVATEDAYLEEGNHWHDNYWGACRCAAHAGDGLNYLGRILMMARDLIRVDE
jgi:ribA/ribD-fused uncharacterized protein